MGAKLKIVIYQPYPSFSKRDTLQAKASVLHGVGQFVSPRLEFHVFEEINGATRWKEKY